MTDTPPFIEIYPHFPTKKKRRGHFEGLNGTAGGYGWRQIKGNQIN